ncbi:GAF domain-containing sensor histidine kinase [Streptomyces griseorubiginosus]|uniref:GAF domain-containing sensor histidine kinase n=1 Tax=Streptomyces griseorubiginosus TaxID=67304 RepID=UPI001AD624DE|nr:histidine kinase [Streptomyces griseorubiginosus]MBO4252298.1 GAF domain-containing protein [Streptomyces griseorubiginosus]
MNIHAPAKAIALQPTPSAVVRAAVDVARDALGSDVAFAAVGTGSTEFPITSAKGIRDPRWNSIVVRPHTGLGGEVLTRERPMIVADYATDAHISRDFVEIVARGEGLRAVACVPVSGPAGVEALLYAGAHLDGVLGDRAVAVLEQLGAFVSVGLEQIRVRELELELARLRERERLANELHDSVAQRLFTIGALAQASRAKEDPVGHLEAIEEIEATAADARRELRDTLLALHRDPENLTFDVQLDGELRLLEDVTGCTVRVVRRGTFARMPDHIARLVIDTAVEGARNAVKHAHASLVEVEIVRAEGRLSLVVRTLAVDMPPEPAHTPPASETGTGTGIRTLRARAERLGGSLRLAAAPTSRAVLRLDLPYNDLAVR